MREIFAGAGSGDHQMIDPAGSVFLGNSLADGEIELAKLVGHERPAHGGDDFVVLEKISELAAGGPVFADVGLELDELLFDGFELRVGEVVELAGVGFVVAEDLRGHVNARELVPERDFALVLRSPQDAPRVWRLREGGGVVEKRIWSPDEGHTVGLTVGLDEWRIAKPGGELVVGRDF